MFNALIKKYFLNKKGEISTTKIGGELMGLAAIIIAIPTMGLGVAVPVAVMTAAKFALAIGGMTAINGARDAIDNKKDE